MTSKYQTISHPNIGGGVDRRSTYNNIPQGFAENMKNMDTNSTGYVRKRKGYQRYNGDLPIRITKIIDAVGNYYEVHFDQSINLLTTPRSPIVISGWLDLLVTVSANPASAVVTYSSDFYGAVGDRVEHNGEVRIITEINTSATTFTLNQAFSTTITTDDVVCTSEVTLYRTSFEKPIPQALPAATAVNTIIQAHAYGTPRGMSRVVSTNPSDTTLNNEWMEPESVVIDTTQITTIINTDQLSEVVDVYVFNDREDIVGRETYFTSGTEAGMSDGDLLEISIPAVDHNFSNLNIIPEVYLTDDNGDTLTRIVPDEVTIAVDGEISFSLRVDEAWIDDGSRDVAGDVDWVVQIHALPADHSYEELAVISGGAATTNTIIFDDVSNPFNFVSVFIREEGVSEQMMALPDEVRYVEDGDSGRIEVDITVISAVTVHLTYMEGYLSANSILIDKNGLELNIDEDINNVQACLYGIAQDSIFYREADFAGGHTNTLAEYSSEGVNKLVVGMGGNLFEEQNISAGAIILPETDAYMRRRVSTKKIVGPFFGKVSPRGVTASNLVNSYYADISYIENNQDGTATISLNLVDKAGSLEDLIWTGKDSWANGEGYDKLTIAAAGNSWYVGSFEILSASDTEDSITISIPNLPNYIHNEENVGGSAYIDTDYILLNSVADGDLLSSELNFENGDLINSTIFTEKPTVIGINRFDDTGLDSYVLFLEGIKETVTIPSLANMTATRISNIVPVSDTTDFVLGDVLNIKGYDRKFTVLDIDTDESTITIDEEISFIDTADINRTSLTVSGRWKAIESPESPAVNKATIDYFDEEVYARKSRLRSASLNDSLYFTDYNNEVMKYDGANLYRAGLPNWQPRSHSWVNYEEEVITLPTYQYDQYVSSDPDFYLQFLSADAMPPVSAGDKLWIETNGVGFGDFYNVAGVDTTDWRVHISALDTALPAGLITFGEVSSPVSIAYYFKIQMYDRNNNIIASAVTDYQECIVELEKSGKVYHRLYGMPKLDTYDYDRIDLMVYRSAMASTITPIFYQIQRIPLDYKTERGINNIIVTDSFNNISLPIGQASNDRASVALKGAEQPISTEQPPRSKYIGSAANRLVLGNIRSYNQLEIFMDAPTKTAEVNVMDGMVIDLNSNDDSKSFIFVPALDEDDMNDSNLRLASAITFDADNQISITVPDIGAADDLIGKYIQLDSFYVQFATGNDVYSFDGRTVDNTIGEILGWWKVLEHNDLGGGDHELVIQCEHNHEGAIVSIDDTADDALLYVAFNNDDDSIPIIAHPYLQNATSLTIVNDSVNKLGFRDTANILEYTTSIDRGIKDFKRAFNQIMLSIENPWAIAKAGTTEGAGTLVITAVKADEAIDITITPDTNGEDIALYVNQLKTAHGVLSNGITYVYPSRLIISKEGYPEMLDAPFAISRIYSDTLVDINADDGQEITGFSTFFGASSSSGSQLEETLIVFKNRSVYAVQLTTGLYQKLESMEQGCTIPDSISPVKNGIMFANASGLYIVNRDLTVTYIGEYIEDYWNEDINKTDAITQAIGFNDSSNRKYKLSIPRSEDSLNDEVVVFDYIGGRRQESEGAWSFYDNFPATGWVQTNNAVYFSSYAGRVYSLRNLGEATDLRDDAEGISSEFLYGATSFGDSGSRVALSKIITHLKAVTDLTGAKIYIATDMENEFTEAGTLEFDKDEVNAKKLYSIAASLPDSHCLFVQVKYTHSTKDEDMVIAGLEYKAMPLSELGIKQTIASAPAR